MRLSDLRGILDSLGLEISPDTRGYTIARGSKKINFLIRRTFENGTELKCPISFYIESDPIVPDNVQSKIRNALMITDDWKLKQ